MDELSGDEKSFYEDQNSNKIARLSEEIDIDYEKEKRQTFITQYEEEQMTATEYDFAMIFSSENEDTKHSPIS